MAFGVTATGFAKKTLDEILDEIEAAERAGISASLSLAPDSVLGQINGVFADKLRELWDVSEAVYRSLYPDSATGEALDNVAAITGALRQPATQSTVTVTCTGTPATFLPAGRVVSVDVTGALFASIADATIGGGGTVEVEFASQEYGPIAAPAGTLDNIETPVAGWASATNALDAQLGTNLEDDAAFRLRRLVLLSVAGRGTVEAIRANVLTVADVAQAFVFENVSNVTDVDGLPPHSFEVVALGGDDTAIARTIFETKPAGIETYGTSTESVADSQGFSHTINFSRPVEVDIWIAVTVQVNPATFGGGDTPTGIAQVKEALVAKGDLLDIGADVISLGFKCEPLHVAGVVDVTAFTIDTIPVPVNTGNIVVATRDLAVFDTSRISVTVI